MIKISIIIPSYKRPELIGTLLSSMQKTLWGEMKPEVIVVDNGDCLETKVECEKYTDVIPNLRYIVEKNPGLSNARNTGVKATRGEYVLLLDDDVTFDEKWYQYLLDQVSTDDENIYCPRLLCPIGEQWPKWLKDRISSGVGQYDFGEKSQIFCGSSAKLPVGAAVAFPRSFFERFGPFDINLDRVKRQLLGGSDSLFFRKAIQSGACVSYVANSIVYHHLTSEKQNKQYWIRQAYHGGRSYIRMNRFSFLRRMKLLAVSFAGAIWHGVSALFDWPNQFKHFYHGTAHVGRCKEALCWWGN